jgi:hypothetical protein
VVEGLAIPETLITAVPGETLLFRYTHSPSSQAAALVGHAEHAVPILYMLEPPPTTLPPGP